MTRKLLAIIAVAVVTLVFTGCSNNGEEQSGKKITAQSKDDKFPTIEDAKKCFMELAPLNIKKGSTGIDLDSRRINANFMDSRYVRGVQDGRYTLTKFEKIDGMVRGGDGLYEMIIDLEIEENKEACQNSKDGCSFKEGEKTRTEKITVQFERTEKGWRDPDDGSCLIPR